MLWETQYQLSCGQELLSVDAGEASVRKVEPAETSALKCMQDHAKKSQEAGSSRWHPRTGHWLRVQGTFLPQAEMDSSEVFFMVRLRSIVLSPIFIH